MLTLNSKYNFRANVSDSIFYAFNAIATVKGLPVTVFLQVNTKLTAIVKNSTNPMMKDSRKTWITLGDYSVQVKTADYDKLNELSLYENGQSIDEYLSSVVAYW